MNHSKPRLISVGGSITSSPGTTAFGDSPCPEGPCAYAARRAGPIGPAGSARRANPVGPASTVSRHIETKAQRRWLMSASSVGYCRGRVAKILIEPAAESAYRVIVEDGRQRTTHTVRVTSKDMARYAPPGTTPERLLEASFEFLLEREPASSILPTFALPV